MNDDELALLVLAGIIGYGALQNVFQPAPIDKNRFSQALSDAGLKTYDTNTGSYAVAGDTTFKLPVGAPLNLAQRILIGFDRIVPGTFLTKWALT